MESAQEAATAAEETLSLIKESLQYYDTKGLKTLILEEKLSDQSIYLEVASEIIKYLTDENLQKYSVFFETCERCLNYLIKTGNPKELLLALLEQADTFHDDTKFKVLLQGIQTLLLKLPSKRFHSLDITMATLHAHIKTLELPKDYELEGEERKLLELDPKVLRITDVLLAYLSFLEPFVWEVSLQNTEVDRQKSVHQVKLLTEYLMKLLNHPLLSLDLTFKQEKKELTYSRECAEKTVKLLQQLCPNFIKTIEMSLEERKLIESKKKRRLKKKKVVDTEMGIAEDEDIVENWEQCHEEEDRLFSRESLACLCYLLQHELLGEDNIPAVFTHQFMFEFHLEFLDLLLQREESLIVQKGVYLLRTLIFKIPQASMTLMDLDNTNYNKILNLLIHVMIRCPVKDVRAICVQILPTYIQMFDLPARVKVYEMIFSTCQHSGVVGYAVQLVKDQIDVVLKHELADTNFLGENLKRMLLFTSRLQEGAESDLLEASDRVIAVLNLIRYLILRDPQDVNKTGIWSYYEDLEREFFQPLRLALDFSKSHYKLELKNFQEGKVTVEKGMELGVNVSVGGMPMPKVPRDQQIHIVQTAINTFDLIDSLLSRIVEIVFRRIAFPTLRRLSDQASGSEDTFKNKQAKSSSDGSSSDDAYSSDYDSSAETETEFQTKQRILAASLPFVHQYGWTRKALAAGADEEGLPSVAHGMFPRGGAELVFYFYGVCNENLESQLKAEANRRKENDETAKTSEVVRNAIETRLRMITRYKDIWPQAMAIQVLPQKSVEAWTNLLTLADNIWFHAGDKSVDFNWYTKRVSVASVYKTVEIFMLQDGSDDNEETWKFLDRRLSDLAMFGKCVGKAEQTTDVAVEGITGAMIMGRNMLGMNSWFR